MSQSAVQKDEISAEQPTTHPPSMAFGKALNTKMSTSQIPKRLSKESDE